MAFISWFRDKRLQFQDQLMSLPGGNKVGKPWVTKKCLFGSIQNLIKTLLGIFLSLLLNRNHEFVIWNDELIRQSISVVSASQILTEGLFWSWSSQLEIRLERVSSQVIKLTGIWQHSFSSPTSANSVYFNIPELKPRWPDWKIGHKYFTNTWETTKVADLPNNQIQSI